MLPAWALPQALGESLDLGGQSNPGLCVRSVDQSTGSLVHQMHERTIRRLPTRYRIHDGTAHGVGYGFCRVRREFDASTSHHQWPDRTIQPGFRLGAAVSCGNLQIIEHIMAL
ncbi:hypothetical protein ACFRFQ_00850 [Rhodococcus sp. NPDC056743]|uniref:hypothetical protein n=1 Tax=Rhodococcus sp. NPDC056743 TaxID=3345934 RepID=UPI0036727A82